MPKSRHGRGKHPHYNKKSRIMQRQGAAATPSQAIAGTPESAQAAAPASATPARRAGTAPPMPKIASMAAAKTATNPYPFITSELRRIAVLALIIIAILVVLSITLS